MITLVNLGKAANLGTQFAVMNEGEQIATAYRHDNGPRRGLYVYEDQVFSRARLINHFSNLLDVPVAIGDYLEPGVRVIFLNQDGFLTAYDEPEEEEANVANGAHRHYNHSERSTQ